MFAIEVGREAFRRGFIFALLLLCAIAFAPNASAAADWPTYRRDNSRVGSTVDSLAVPLKLRWTYSAPAAPLAAWAGPDRRVIEGHKLRHRVSYDDALQVAVVGDRVYFGSSVDHSLHCVSAKTSRELWRFASGGPIRLAPTVDDGRVLFGSDDGYVYCLDAGTGKLRWKLRAGPDESWLLARGEMISRWPVRTGVVVEDGIAYFGAGIFPHEDVYLYAVKAEDGSVAWKRDNISQQDAGRDDLSPQGYLLASKDALFVTSGRSLPAVFDRATGKKLHKRTFGWRSTAGGVVGGTKGLLADGQIYAAGEHHLLALDQKTGDVGFGYFAGKQMCAAGQDAYLVSGESIARVHRLEYAKASRARQTLKLEIYGLTRQLRSRPANADKIRARIAAAREEVKKTEKTGLKWSTPCLAEAAVAACGNLAFAGGENEVRAFDAQTGEPAWQAQVEGSARGLAVANGYLFVSTTSGRIYCFAGAKQDVGQLVAAKRPVANPYGEDKLTDMYESAAKDILKRSGVDDGFCLVLGGEQGRLAYELAKRSDLKVYCIEPDAEKAKAAREALSQAGLYGSRVVVHQADPAAVPYSNYFANLVVSDSLLLTGEVPGNPKDIARHVKPLGGVVCLGKPEGSPGKPVTTDLTEKYLRRMGLGRFANIETDVPWVKLTRGKLPGAGSWSHQYGEPGNTAASDERRITKGGLGVLWYGDPGPGKMVNRHEGAVGPLAVNGRLIVQGENSLMAYDAYNGQFLWENKNPEAVRTGVFQNQNPGNLAADDDRVFMMTRDKCLEFDAAGGKLARQHLLPESKRDGTYEWGYVAVKNGLLIGTATIRKELEARLRRRGRKSQDATDMIFAIDIASGKHLWQYQGKSITHFTIAMGPRRIYFIDSTVTAEQREEVLRQDKTELAKLTGQEAKLAEERMKRLDARVATALDARSGRLLWSKPVDVTDCSNIGTGGGRLTLMYKDGVLILGGANANGHYWRQFLSGEFSRRRVLALSAADGKKLWSKDANYRHRPIILAGQVIAEPWSFDLKTGRQRMRRHPLTGQQVPWSIIRPGHHCGMITGCDNMLLFRSGYTGFYDLKADSGTRHFAGHRLGCWINAIPANGLVSIPEASAGCVCLFSIASTIVLEPREARRPWAIYSATGAKTPVKHLHLNLGAPGDRRDAKGKLWLAYPRPNPKKVTGLDMPLDIQPRFFSGGGFHSDSETSLVVDPSHSSSSWLYANFARGFTGCTIPLLGKKDAPATYTLRLHFARFQRNAGGADFTPGLEVKVQGQSVLKDFKLPTPGKGGIELAVKEFANVKVKDNLVIELALRPADGKARQSMPVLCAIEVQREADKQ